jgi:hypothetical protein
MSSSDRDNSGMDEESSDCEDMDKPDIPEIGHYDMSIEEDYPVQSGLAQVVPHVRFQKQHGFSPDCHIGFGKDGECIIHM